MRHGQVESDRQSEPADSRAELPEQRGRTGFIQYIRSLPLEEQIQAVKPPALGDPSAAGHCVREDGEATSARPPVLAVGGSPKPGTGRAEAALSGQSVEATASGAAGGARGVQMEADAAESSQTYVCFLGASSFQVTVGGGGAQRVTLAGYPSELGALTIHSLAGRLSQGSKGPSGRVSGRASIMGADARVTGRFFGRSLVLSANVRGPVALWPGLELRKAKLRIGRKGVTGSGVAGYTIPGVTGRVELRWGAEGFKAETTERVRLPWLGKVTFTAVVNGSSFHFTATTEAVPGASIGHATLAIRQATIEAVDGQLTGLVKAHFADSDRVLDGAIDLTVKGADHVGGSGTVSLKLAEAVGFPANLTFGADGTATASALGVPIDVAGGALRGALDVVWDTTEGLRVSSASGLKVRTPWGTDAEVENLAISDRSLRCTARVPLEGIPGLAFGGDANLAVAFDGDTVSGEVGPLSFSSTVTPGLAGELALRWSTAEGVSGSASASVEQAGGTAALSFEELSWQPGVGLTGEALVAAQDLGLDWTAAPFVRALEGAASLRLEAGALVSGSGTATATFDFGVVSIQLDGFGSAGPSARLTALINNLGPNVVLAGPLVIQGAHRDGQTSFEAAGIAFSVVTSGEELRLDGALQELVVDQSGLTSSLDLQFFAGHLGLATAQAKVKEGRLARAELTFATPVFRFPASQPVIEGTFSKTDLAYEDGRFTGGVAGDADLAIRGADTEGGRLHFDASANPSGGLDLDIEGQEIETSILTIERFFLKVKDGNIDVDIAASASDDLPFQLNGSVTGGWDEAGLTLAGGFEIQSKPGQVPDLGGKVDVGYNGAVGLWAAGSASVVLDRQRNLAAQATLIYSDGSLWVSAAARALWEAKSPLVDLSLVLGPKIDKLSGKLEFPVVGIPYVHGFTASLEVTAGLHLGTDLRGISVDAGLLPWDVLGDQPPEIDASVQWRGRPLELGFGVQVAGRLLGHFVGVTIGVETGLKAGFDLTSKDPTVRARATWDDEGEVIGQLFANLPMVLQMSPEGWFQVVAGLSKWAVGIPGTKQVWKPEPITLAELDPLHFEWRLEDLFRDESAEGEAGIYGLGGLTQPRGLDKRRDPLIKGMIDQNPKLKAVVDTILGAVEIFDYALEEGEAFYEWISEFDSRIASGESLETAQRNANFLEKILREQRSLPRDLPRLAGNVRYKAEAGDIKGLFSALEELLRALSDFLANCRTLEGMFGQPIDRVLEAKIGSSRSGVVAHMNELAKAIALGAG